MAETGAVIKIKTLQLLSQEQMHNISDKFRKHGNDNLMVEMLGISA